MVKQLIRRTAKELAGAFFEGQTQFIRGQLEQHPDSPGRSERFRALAGKEKDFIAHNWPTFVEPARRTLAQMLSMPNYSQHIKDEIFDALLADQGLETEEQASKRIPAGFLASH